MFRDIMIRFFYLLKRWGIDPAFFIGSIGFLMALHYLQIDFSRENVSRYTKFKDLFVAIFFAAIALFGFLQMIGVVH